MHEWINRNTPIAEGVSAVGYGFSLHFIGISGAQGLLRGIPGITVGGCREDEG